VFRLRYQLPATATPITATAQGQQVTVTLNLGGVQINSAGDIDLVGDLVKDKVVRQLVDVFNASNKLCLSMMESYWPTVKDHRFDTDPADREFGRLQARAIALVGPPTG
jgi:hypothetical protein